MHGITEELLRGGQRMTKKLGKLTALWLCWELWDWLAKNPNREKGDWPGWKINGGKCDTAPSECFACEYRFTTSSDYCYEDCIVPCFRYKIGGCENTKSPFVKWQSIWNTSKKYARIIANSAYDEYVKLGGKKRK